MKTYYLILDTLFPITCKNCGTKFKRPLKFTNETIESGVRYYNIRKILCINCKCYK